MRHSALFLLVVFTITYISWGQECKIIGYDRNGKLTFASSTGSGSFTLEFSGDLGGPWTNWGTVTERSITGAVMTLPTPMFFRIKEISSDQSSVVSNRALELYLITQGLDQNGDGRINIQEASQVLYITFFNVIPQSNPLIGLQPQNLGAGWHWTTLDFSPFTNITQISIQTMSSLTYIAVSSLPKLLGLVCEKTNVSDLELTNTTALRYLSCKNNLLTSLDISSNTNLTEVYATGNFLKEIVVWWNPTDTPPITLTYDGTPTIRQK